MLAFIFMTKVSLQVQFELLYPEMLENAKTLKILSF